MNDFRVFSGGASKVLTQSICSRLSGVFNQGQVYLERFPSGEPYCQFQENIRGKDVFLVQSICAPANDNFMELLVMIDAAKRASAGRITAVTPLMGYLRQDRKTKSRTPITAKLAMNMLVAAGAQRLMGMDYHFEQAQGLVDIPVDHLYAMPVFANYIRENFAISDVVAVAPDVNGLKRAEAFSRVLKVGLGFCAKKRTNATSVEGLGFVGDVAGKTALLIDDMTESLGTIINAGNACFENGAKAVYGLVTHPLLTEVGFKRYSENVGKSFTGLITTNSVPLTRDEPTIVKLDVSELFAKAILRNHKNESISELFEVQGF